MPVILVKACLFRTFLHIYSHAAFSYFFSSLKALTKSISLGVSSVFFLVTLVIGSCVPKEICPDEVNPTPKE